MSHAAQRAFFAAVKEQFPAAFDSVRALDCGALDVNGSMREMFTNSEYIGVDMRPGRNVDIVATVHELDFPDGSFDTILSAEMLEHDEFWQDSLRKMYALLRSGGLLALSMASPERAEHGTTRVPDTEGDGIWGSSPDYYRGLSESDLHFVFDMAEFSAYQMLTSGGDLYFWGFKV